MKKDDKCDIGKQDMPITNCQCHFGRFCLQNILPDSVGPTVKLDPRDNIYFLPGRRLNSPVKPFPAK